MKFISSFSEEICLYWTDQWHLCLLQKQARVSQTELCSHALGAEGEAGVYPNDWIFETVYLHAFVYLKQTGSWTETGAQESWYWVRVELCHPALHCSLLLCPSQSTESCSLHRRPAETSRGADTGTELTGEGTRKWAKNGRRQNPNYEHNYSSKTK